LYLCIIKDMQTKTGNLHLEIQTSRKNPVGILRTTFWDKKSKKASHTQHGRITGCSMEQLKMIQCAFREEVVPSGDQDAYRILSSRELGASRAILNVAKDLGLNRILYSRSEPWVDCVLAMVVGRIVFQGSKLGLCNQSGNTALWELCGVEGKPIVEKHCYLPMDRLLERQTAIQKKLAKNHLQNGAMVLYDITSSYFEGEYEDSELVSFGYNRDGKKGHEQVVVGLMTNAGGCPVGCEVFKGNTNDSTTVMGKIDEVRSAYGLKDFIFVGDRGMVTQGRFDEIRQLDQVNSISALTHGQLKTLLDRDVLAPELFDVENTVEIIDPEDLELRYCLCKNPLTAEKERTTRLRLISLTAEGLEKIANYKKSATTDQLAARVGRLIEKYKMGKFFEWSIRADPEKKKSQHHKLNWTLKAEKVKQEERLDGCYVIRTDVSPATLDSSSVVGAYKSLGNVERAFRNMKTVQLEMRPFYHKTDDRIRAHVFLCMLAYYLQWHMMQRLQPLFDADGAGSDRRRTFSGVIDCLKSQQRHTVRIKGVEFQRDGEETDEQKRIMALLTT
jgi:transposase